VRVFARVTAEHKMRIVRALKARLQVVSMTGDGVNDAPSIKEANIGVAMGLGGTDVAREAADMVLADDNFATMVVAVREGRAIFRNIQKFIFFLLSSNTGLVLLVFFASMLDWAEPLTPLQILWINLVTNGLPALALGVDPPDPGQMKERPRRVSEGILGGRDYLAMIVVGFIMAMASLYLYARAGMGVDAGESPAESARQMAHARTMVFTLLALSPLFHTLNCRSRTVSALSGLFTNKFLWLANLTSAGIHLLTFTAALRPIFKTTWMSASDWALVLALSALPILAFEVWKLLVRFTGHRKPLQTAEAGAAPGG
jgi:Ca2+-transporting ATPase